MAQQKNEGGYDRSAEVEQPIRAEAVHDPGSNVGRVLQCQHLSYCGDCSICIGESRGLEQADEMISTARKAVVVPSASNEAQIRIADVTWKPTQQGEVIVRLH